MIERIKGLGKSINGPIFFAIINVGTAAFGFILIPLLTRSLNSAAFAVWVICESVWLLSGQLLQLGLGNGAIMQASSGLHSWRSVYRAHVGFLKWALLLGGLFAASISWSLDQRGIALAIALNVAAEGAVTYQTYAARAAGVQMMYAALTAVRAMTIVGAIGFISVLGHDDQGSRLHWMLMARALCSWLIAFLCHLYSWRGMVGFKDPEDRKICTDAIRFGAPMAASGVLLFTQESLLRSALASLINAEAVEQYYVHAKCVSIAGTFIVGPVGLWWGAQRFRLASQGQDHLERGARRALQRSLLTYAVLLGCMAVALPELLKTFGPRVRPDIWLIALLALPPAAQLVATLTNAGLMQAGHTQSLAWIQCLGLVLLLVGVAPAAHWGGLLGVCAISAIAAIAVAWFTALGSLKRLPLNYRLTPTVLTALAALAISLLVASVIR